MEEGKTRYHVICKKLDPAHHDVYDAYAATEDFEEKLSEDVEVGEEAHYVQALTDDGAAAFRRASNLRSLEPVEAVFAHDATVHGRVFPDAEGDVEASFTLPDINTVKFHWCGRLPDRLDGRRVTVLGADTGLGMRQPVAEKMRARGVTVKPGRNFTSNDDGDPAVTTDRHGHGSGTGAMCVLGTRATFRPLKVLADSGAGDSAGIADSFYWAGRYAENHPDEVVIYNGSFGSDVDSLYQAYVKPIKFATDRGVIFIFSAGNAGKNLIARPANTCRVNPRVCSSIAFDKETHRRAGFSNHDEDCTLSDAGQREVGYKQDGRLYYLSGTSFSAPNTTYVATRLATEHPGPKVLRVMAANGRDTKEPTREEGGGVAHGLASYNKLEAARSSEPQTEQLDRWRFASKAVTKLLKGPRLEILYAGKIIGVFIPERLRKE